jgi:diguanylate cyclase (GGDEF)-like protein/PAS domain S-box-containing protein
VKFKRLSHLYLAVALGLSLSFGGLLGGGLLLAYYHASAHLGQLAKESLLEQSMQLTREQQVIQATFIADQLSVIDSPEGVSSSLGLLLQQHGRNQILRLELYDASGVLQGSAGLASEELPNPDNEQAALKQVDATDTISVPLSRASAPGGWLVAYLADPAISANAGMAAVDAEVSKGWSQAFVTLSLNLMVVLLLCIGAVWILTRNLIPPIRAMGRFADNVGKGDLESPLDISRPDEIGALADALRGMRETLNQTTISRDYLDRVLNSMKDAVLVTSADGVINRCNTGACEMLEYAQSALTGMHIRELFAERARSDFSMDLLSARSGESTFLAASGCEIPVSLSGSAISSDNAQDQGYILVARNISDQKRAEKRIRYLARYDALTRVPNRMQFQHLMQRSLSRARRAHECVALLSVDLDRFKEINDRFGHLSGDRSLETVAERITRELPEDTVVGRLAGDEFGILLEGLGSESAGRDQASALARMLLAEIARPFHFQQREIDLSGSLGIAMFPDDAGNVIDMIRNADAAMQNAKKQGGNTFAFYQPEMNADSAEQLMLKAKLRRALAREEFVLRYQPKLDVNDGRIVGAEALMRWQLPGHGEVSPGYFIPMAEESSLIIAMGDWVLNQVCEDFQTWRAELTHPGRIAVNLSLRQLQQKDLAKRVEAIFRTHGVSPTCFEFEITESTLMDNPDASLRILNELYSMGIHLSIDDFGTGYSSLSALQQFPISTLKIDQSFVRDANVNQDDATIVSTIIEMGRSLRMDVVAEGVENEEQLSLLRAKKCHFVQGHLLGPPMSAEAYLGLLKAELQGKKLHGELFRNARVPA